MVYCVLVTRKISDFSLFVFYYAKLRFVCFFSIFSFILLWFTGALPPYPHQGAALDLPRGLNGHSKNGCVPFGFPMLVALSYSLCPIIPEQNVLQRRTKDLRP